MGSIFSITSLICYKWLLRGSNEHATECLFRLAHSHNHGMWRRQVGHARAWLYVASREDFGKSCQRLLSVNSGR